MKKILDFLLYHLNNEWNWAKAVFVTVVLAFALVVPWAVVISQQSYSGVGVSAVNWIGLGLSLVTAWVIIFLHHKNATRHGDK